MTKQEIFEYQVSGALTPKECANDLLLSCMKEGSLSGAIHYAFSHKAAYQDDPEKFKFWSDVLEYLFNFRKVDLKPIEKFYNTIPVPDFSKRFWLFSTADDECAAGALWDCEETFDTIDQLYVYVFRHYVKRKISDIHDTLEVYDSKNYKYYLLQDKQNED